MNETLFEYAKYPIMVDGLRLIHLYIEKKDVKEGAEGSHAKQYGEKKGKGCWSRPTKRTEGYAGRIYVRDTYMGKKESYF